MLRLWSLLQLNSLTRYAPISQQAEEKVLKTL